MRRRLVAGITRDHGLARLLGLQEQRIAPAVDHQGHQAHGADAAHAHHFEHHVLQREMLEQFAPVRRQAVEIAAEALGHLLLPGGGVGPMLVLAQQGDGAGRMEHRRRRVADAPQAVVLVRHLAQHAFVGAAGGLLHCLGDQPAALGRRGVLQHAFEGEAVVPDVQRAVLRVFVHPRLVLGRSRHDDVGAVAAAIAHVRRRHRQAGRQALDVPFPWARGGLVEVVQVEQQLPFGRGEAAEIEQMRIAAKRNRDAGMRRARQVVRLQDGGAAKEGEGGGRHAPVAQWDQGLDAAVAVAAQQPDRIAVDVADGRVRRTLDVLPGLLPG
ncbi:hypothetical protein MyNCGM152_01330 [Achromobacter xylosoxidans]